MITDDIIYLDTSATTPLCAAAREAITAAASCFGNPSSLHRLGAEAERMVNDARRSLLTALGEPDAALQQLVFCGCGSEANNLALAGCARSKAAHRGGRIITTAAEHPSILETASALEREGYEVVRLRAPRGVIDPMELRAAMTPDTFLVSIMLVNNETGAINDVAKLFAVAREVNPDVVTHTDAVQAFMKMRFSPRSLSADLISVSAHKIGAPKGVGALYVSPEVIKTKRLVPIIYGGGQEHGMRAGTENTLGIAAFGAAARAKKQNAAAARALREKLIAALPEGVGFNIPAGEYLPGILSVTLPRIKSETMLHHLSSCGVFVSSGSACSSHSRAPSHVLTDFGLSPREADCTLRLSFDTSLTDSDIARVGAAFASGIDRLARMR